MVLCGTDPITPEGAYLYISSSLKPGADVTKLKTRIEQQVDMLRKGEHRTRVAMVAAGLSRQMRVPMDVRLALKLKTAQIAEEMIIANLGLQWGLLEFQHGDTLSAVAGGLSEVSASDIVSVATTFLSEDRRNALLLTPRP